MDKFETPEGATSKLPVWPSDMGRSGEIRNQYINALRAADGGNCELLIEYTKRYQA